MAISVRDVALRAGVSLGTVSNVLNRPDVVRAATRERVESAMRELGFVPNESARQLRSGSSTTLAYVMLDAGNPFFTDVARGIEDSAQSANMSLFLCNSDNSAERERAYLSRLEQQRVQGILVTPVDPDSALLDEVARRGTPVVIVDRARREPTHCSVSVDDVLGGELAAAHLLELGHTRLAFVGGPASLGQVRDRLAGMRQAVAAHPGDGVELVELRTGALSVVEGRGACERLVGIGRARRPTGVVCANDLLALGFLQQCVSLGLHVPRDLALVGYDDIDFAAAAAVPLSSVRQPRHELGRRAAELLHAERADPDHEHQQLTYTPELVVRASTQPVA